MKHYELNLPENYKLDKVIDAKEQKTALKLTLLSLVIMIIVFIIGMYLFVLSNGELVFTFDEKNLYALLIYFVGFFASIIIHELIHGLFFKIFTKQKLKFGVTLSVAYCGVPDIYVRKKAMIITSLAPLVILSSVLLIPLFIVKDTIYFIFVLLIFSAHFSGCCGDVYCSYLLCFKYKNIDVLVNDTGAKQSFYVKKEQQ